MKIVAFLQNPWFPEGTDERHIICYRDDQEFHRRLLACTMSGRRLEQAFGDLYDEIHWDNTNWRAASLADGIVAPDHKHMIGVIKQEQPELILGFGKQAKDAVRVIWGLLPVWNLEFLDCHHPNARGKTQQDLDDFATLVRRKMLEHDLLGQKRKMSEETL